MNWELLLRKYMRHADEEKAMLEKLDKEESNWEP